MPSTIFRLPTSFENSSLPIVAPLVRSGLVAAWRLYSGESSLYDLSGNGHRLTAVGSPEWTENGVTVGQNDYFVSDVPDSLNRTIIVVSRPVLLEDGSASDSPAVGNRATINGESYGLGIWHNGTTSVQNLNMITTGPDSNDDLVGNTNTFGGSRPRPAGAGPMELAFAAVSYDASNNRTIGRAPRYNVAATSIDWDSASPYPQLGERPLTLPDGEPNWLRIGNEPGNGSLNAQSVVCEVLIYDGVLSEAQILEQYDYSKAFYSDVFGVDV